MSSIHVAFVRAVMIGREGLHRPVLLDMFERAGGSEATSYISTGNVSFQADPESIGELVELVEADLEQLLGRPTPLFVRTLTELQQLLDDDPFGREPFDEVSARLVTFFRTEVPPTFDVPVEATNGDWSVFAAGPRELFSVTRAWPDRQPQDPGGLVQRLAGEPVTTRAIGTLERIVAKLVG